jgi:phage terminase large subunit GpA-like protein
VPDYLVRYFWLCVSCSSEFTMVFDERRGVSLAPLHDAADHEAESSLILEITAAHFCKHDTGQISNEHKSRMKAELNDTEEAHHGRRTIITRKTRSRR